MNDGGSIFELNGQLETGHGSFLAFVSIIRPYWKQDQRCDRCQHDTTNHEDPLITTKYSHKTFPFHSIPSHSHHPMQCPQLQIKNQQIPSQPLPSNSNILLLLTLPLFPIPPQTRTQPCILHRSNKLIRTTLHDAHFLFLSWSDGDLVVPELVFDSEADGFLGVVKEGLTVGFPDVELVFVVAEGMVLALRGVKRGGVERGWWVLFMGSGWRGNYG